MYGERPQFSLRDVGALFVVLGAAVVLGLVPVIVAARSRGTVWGTRIVRTFRLRGVGPYREGRATVELPRPIPLGVAFAAWSSIAWAVITLFVFVPGGLALGLLGLERDGGYEMILFTLFFILSVEAVPLAIALVAAGLSALRRDASMPATISRWSFAHHVAVFVVFAILAFAISPHPAQASMFTMMVALPCGVGLVQSTLLGRTCKRMLAPTANGPADTTLVTC